MMIFSKLFEKYLYPSQMAKSVFHINYDTLWDDGVRGLIFDIDNTLAVFDTPKADDRTKALLKHLTKMGFSICFLSNNGKGRVIAFSEDFDYPHFWKSKKPRLLGLNKALDAMDMDASKVVIIGDQIFTDCFVGRRAGIYTILTRPIALRDEWQVKLKRMPERIVLKAYGKYRKKHQR